MYRPHNFYLVKCGSHKKSRASSLPYNRQSTASHGIGVETFVCGDLIIRKTLETLALTPSEFYIGGSTSLSGALFDAGALCDNAPFEAEHCVIDISADQSDNDPLPGMNILTVRGSLYERKYQINGLPLVSPDDLGLIQYFLEHVVTPDGFVLAATRGDLPMGSKELLKGNLHLRLPKLSDLLFIACRPTDGQSRPVVETTTATTIADDAAVQMPVAEALAAMRCPSMRFWMWTRPPAIWLGLGGAHW